MKSKAEELQKKAQSLTEEAVEKSKKISAAPAEEAGPLLDEVIEKRKQVEMAWDEVLKPLNQGLGAVPQHRADLTGWWKIGIEKASDQKNEAADEIKKFISWRASLEENSESSEK